jgi:hypothetical protein
MVELVCGLHGLQFLSAFRPASMNLKTFSISALLIVAALLVGCLQVKTHSTIDPVHVTVDVNVNVRVQQELADVFGDIDAASTTFAATGPVAE